MDAVRVAGFAFLSILSSCAAFEFSLGAPAAPGSNIPKAYEPNFRPNHGAVADMLSISVDSLSIHGINEKESNLLVDLALRISWTDPRLANAVNKSTTFIKSFPNIWLPDVFILDSSDQTVGKSIRIKPEGEVVLSERHLAKLNCAMTFVKLPFDVQTCGIRIKSHAFSTIHLDMVWNGRLDDLKVKVFDSEFNLGSLVQSSDKEMEIDGEFRILSATMKLRRNPFKYFKFIMIPGLIFAIIAYLTLFITEDSSSEDAPNRVSFQFGVIRTSISALAFFVYQLITQLYYSNAAGEGVLTGADVWIWTISAVQFFLFLFNVTLLVASRQMLRQSTIEEKSKPCLLRIGKLLILGIPIAAMIFLIIYFMAYLI